MTIRSILKPEGSVMASLAVAGIVFSAYNLSVGSIAQSHATTANHPALEASRKKAGYTSFILVAGLSLITKDGNVMTVGFGSIIAMELLYRQGIMASPDTGQIVSPTPSAYQPAENVIPIDAQSNIAAGY